MAVCFEQNLHMKNEKPQISSVGSISLVSVYYPNGCNERNTRHFLHIGTFGQKLGLFGPNGTGADIEKQMKTGRRGDPLVKV